jgi:transposase
MASIARRWQDLDAEVTRLDAALGGLVSRAAPAHFLARQGVATQTAAAGDNPARITTEAGFAALCGVSPAGCSSGKQQHHRLNRGGGRQANSALWRIVTTRIQHDPETRAYVKRRTAEGKSPRHIKRCLKRYVARRTYKDLIRPGHRPAHTEAP